MKKTTTLLITLSLFTGISCSSPKASAPKEVPIQVEAYRPIVNDSNAIHLSGQLSSQKNIGISTRLMAYVEQIYVKMGDPVKKGDLLVRLNAADLNAKKAQVLAQISEVQAATQNARRDLERYQTLHRKGSVSDKELENMQLNATSFEAKLKMAQQALKEVDAQLSYTHIRAPFSGVITRQIAEEGSMAHPGAPLLEMEQEQQIEVVSQVPENYIGQVTVGDPVKVEIKAIPLTTTGQVSELSPSSTQNGGQYTMKVSLDDAGNASLRSGMYVNLQLQQKGTEVSSSNLYVESSSLIQREQLQGVYVVNKENKAVIHWLRTGHRQGNLVEVLSGLNQNERVIKNEQGKLYNGCTVSVINK